MTLLHVAEQLNSCCVVVWAPNHVLYCLPACLPACLQAQDRTLVAQRMRDHVHNPGAPLLPLPQLLPLGLLPRLPRLHSGWR